MGAMFTGNALWQLVMQSDSMTYLVLLILLTLSIICWSIFFCKVFLFFFKRKQLNHVIAQLKNAYTMEDIQKITQKYPRTLPGYFFSKSLTFLKIVCKIGTGQEHQLHIDRLQQYTDQLLDAIIMHEQAYLGALSTSAAVAPLLGLFGTVWGLIHAFVSISERQAADIATVAPGIAQALITTLVGLMVAIPALVMFNYLMTQIHFIEQQLLVLADKFTMLAHQSRCKE